MLNRPARDIRFIVTGACSPKRLLLGIHRFKIFICNAVSQGNLITMQRVGIALKELEQLSL